MKAKRITLSVLVGTYLLFSSLLPAVTTAHGAVPIGSGAVDSDKYVRTELYFGLSRDSGPDVSEEEFQRFIDEFVTPRFPEGLTILNAKGQWRSNGTEAIVKEQSKVLIIIYSKRSRRDSSAKIEEIRSEYKKRFAQSSVMRIDMGKSLDVSF